MRVPLRLSGRHLAKRCWGGEVRSVAVLVAMGVRADGFREVLGVMGRAKEDAESWRTFLRRLKERGLQRAAGGQ